MTPIKLDWRSLRAKLRKIQELLDNLESWGPFNRERMYADPQAALAAERVITLVVDLAVAVNSHISAAELGEAADNYAASFGLAAKAGAIDKDLARTLEPSARMRNILVLQYLVVDQEKVADAIPAAIEQYGRYVEQVARWLLERQKVSGGT